MKPRGSTSTFVLSRPGIWFGLRPTDTSTLSNTWSRRAPDGSSKLTLRPSFCSVMPTTFVLSSTLSNAFSIFFASTSTRSRSAPGSNPGVISTTVTLLPSAAYTLPSSRPM